MHNQFQDLSAVIMGHFVLLISIMPTILDRGVWGDNLPGLYLWGKSNTGKSYIFNRNPTYSKIPADASGVGRFKLSGVEAAYLIDNACRGFMSNSNNISTIKQLAEGAEPSTKVFGNKANFRHYKQR